MTALPLAFVARPGLPNWVATASFRTALRVAGIERRGAAVVAWIGGSVTDRNGRPHRPDLQPVATGKAGKAYRTPTRTGASSKDRTDGTSAMAVS